MKKRKKKQPKRLMILFCFLLLVVGGGILLYFVWNPSNENPIIFQEKLDFEVNSEVTISSLIKDSLSLEILEKDQKIDTSKLGSQEITIRYKEKETEKSQICTVHIIDETSPVITYKKELSTKVGSNIDLLEGVVVTDNSNEEIQVKVLGDYDINKEGNYSLTYFAVDKSGNETKEDFTLIVSKEKINTYNYPKLPVPDGEKELIGTSSVSTPCPFNTPSRLTLYTRFTSSWKNQRRVSRLWLPKNHRIEDLDAQGSISVATHLISFNLIYAL